MIGTWILKIICINLENFYIEKKCICFVAFLIKSHSTGVFREVRTGAITHLESVWKNKMYWACVYVFCFILYKIMSHFAWNNLHICLPNETKKPQ